jgi:tetraacyldisaccharide 4'-kinase
MKISTLWLAPLSFLYGIGTALRNYLFDIGYSRSFNYDIMVVLVGNLSAGGAGKSPMTEYLIRQLQAKYSLATLSRGYKRKTKGFVIAENHTDASEIGDEPYQMYLKYGDIAKIAVGEERSIAIPNILLEHPETQIIIMDDGYQHRTVMPDFSILLTDYHHLFTDDHLLPWGRLREAKKGARRADVIVVTKCPERLSDSDCLQITHKIHRFSGYDMPVFYSRIKYNPTLSLSKSDTLPTKVIGFSGLANSDQFCDYIHSQYQLVEMISFKDHHDYTTDDIALLVNRASEAGADLITTEKDMVKFKDKNRAKLLKEVLLYYVPIEHYFVKDGNVFDKLVEDAITDKYTTEEE